MGANAQTSVPTFTAGEILTAANMNISARTGIPVFADSTARDAAFGGTQKTLAEGQLAYLENTNVVQYYDGATWATVGPTPAPGLELVSTTTIGSAVSSVTVSNAFSATYDNYYISVTGGVASTDLDLQLTLGATTTGYYSSLIYLAFGGGSVTAASGSNAANWAYTGAGSTNSLYGQFFLYGPNLAKQTYVASSFMRNNTGGIAGQFIGFLANSTQYTALTLTTSTGNLTGGSVRVYGYKN